jgi:hypothetical protein
MSRLVLNLSVHYDVHKQSESELYAEPDGASPNLLTNWFLGSISIISFSPCPGFLCGLFSCVSDDNLDAFLISHPQPQFMKASLSWSFSCLHDSSWTFRPVKVRPIRCLETSGTSCLVSRSQIPEERNPLLHRRCCIRNVQSLKNMNRNKFSNSLYKMLKKILCFGKVVMNDDAAYVRSCYPKHTSESPIRKRIVSPRPKKARKIKCETCRLYWSAYLRVL